MRKLKLIKVVGICLMLGAFFIIPNDKEEWYHSVLEILIFNVGYIMVCWKKLKKYWFRLIGGKSIIIYFFLFSSLNTTAQDYTEQVGVFKEAFARKNIDSLAKYLSPKLRFGEIPSSKTGAIMTNIVSKLPTLNNLSILEREKRKVKVRYDFEALGVRESHLFFDEKGRIERIELVENLIQLEVEAQKKLKEMVQLPSPGDLGKKYLPKSVQFNASDGLIVSGNLYEVDRNKPIILLCHQAGYNRMEYADIAPKLNAMGYNCLAIDLRSGGNFAQKLNETAERAAEKEMKPEMLDARQDLKAAVDYLHSNYNQEVTVWGSSYSSSLALIEARENKKIKAVLAFSPGDYFGRNAPSLSEVFAEIDKPFLVTSSKQESEALSMLVGSDKLQQIQYQFIPDSEGFHGSKALWEGQKGADEYWAAVTEFLKTVN